ncbi:MAG TPA: hypothetical protein VI893_08585, partial [Thermoplasmata archaeon]|nr:hypothetical protein [Thermoplasmata archaeon]
GGAEAEFTMTRAAKVSGRIMLGDHNEAGQNLRVALYSSETGGRTTAITNTTGSYIAWVPHGTYTLVVQEDRITSGYALLDRKSVFGTVDLGDLVAENASVVHGFTYSDLDSDGRVDPGEERSGVRLLVRTGGHLFDSYSTLANGSYRIFIPKDSPAEAEVGGFGWIPHTLPLEEGEMNIQVTENKAKLEGSVRYRDQVIPGDLQFRFSRTVGSGNNTTTEIVNATATDGVLTGELLPGEWQMDLSQPVNQFARWFASGGVEVKHGTSVVELDVQVSKLVNLSVSSDAAGQAVTLRLSGPQKYEANVTDEGSLEVEAGNYTAEASTASLKLFFARADVDEFHSNLSMKLETSALLHGKVEAPSPGSGVKILMGDATTGWSGAVESKAGGEYEVRLIAGREYSVTVDHIMNETVADTQVPVLLSFQGKVFVSKDTPFPIPASKTRLSVHVVGTATDLFGNVAGGAKLLLSNAVIAPVERVVQASGRFDYDVPPGVYNLYATHVSQGVPQSLLTQVVVPAVKDHPLPLQMRYSVTFSGRVEFEQNPATARIRVSGDAVHDFVASGSFSLLLPVGEYSFAAEKKAEEWGMDVAYTASTSASLKESAYYIFDLKRTDLMTATLDWDKTQKQEIKQGERLRSPYVVSIENTGNIVDTWRFSGTLSEWNLTFSPEKVT